MTSFSHLKIGFRLTAAFALLVALMVSLGLIAIWQLSKINSSMDYYVANTTPSLIAIDAWKADLNTLRISRAKHLLATTAAQKNDLDEKMSKTADELGQKLAAYETLLTDDDERRLWIDAKQRIADFIGAWSTIGPLSLAGLTDPSKAEAARTQFSTIGNQAFASAMEAVDKDYDFNVKEASVLQAEAQATYRNAKAIVSGILLLAVLLSAVLAYLLIRSITRPLAQSVAIAERTAAGDLTSDIVVEGSDETAQLLRAMAKMRDSLRAMVSRVRQNADSVATASAQIAQGNADLSQRTEEQASSLQQTAASMEQLHSTVKQNSENANQASQLAHGATEVAQRGGEVVSAVVDTMKGINDSSRKISDIIAVIDGIAFQTNILALNAAVEAARAGEQGRGFAVVASEVRSLAQRSATAAKEIKSLITDSVERVDVGNKLVATAGQTMQEIVSSIQRVGDIVAEISSASNEQTGGIAQVGQAISQMDQVTQQNAALVEESAAAAESLRLQAQALSEAVAVFKTDMTAMQSSAAVRTRDTAPPLVRTVTTPKHSRAQSGPVPAASRSTKAADSWAGTERRSPDRAKNVVRPTFIAAPQTSSAPLPTPSASAPAPAPATPAPPTGTDDDWTTF